MAIGSIANMSLTEVAGLMRSGEVSSREATTACLDRINKYAGRLNCVASIEPETALAEADKADAERAAGRATGPLRGVPLAHKNIFNRKDRIVDAGSLILADNRPSYDATILDRLDAAGAVTLGSLHLAELALSPTGYNEHFGQALNPWDTSRVSGGSSSGSGVAVGARLIFGSLGTDTGGSVRHPAAMCGVVGLKPTQGRVSNYGVIPLSQSLDTVGPIARTAEDCALLLAVIAGHDSQDPSSSDEPVSDYVSHCRRSDERLRIGVPSNYFFDRVDAELTEMLVEVLRVYESQGAMVVDVTTSDIDNVNSLSQIVFTVEAARNYQNALRESPTRLGSQVRNRILPGLQHEESAYQHALASRWHIQKKFIETAFADVDVLFTPAISVPVPTVDETMSEDFAQVAEVIETVTHCTRPFNYLGLPCVVTPAGFSGSGSPVAFQLVGKPFSEANLLCASHAYQQVTDWHRRMPPDLD